MPEKYKEVEHLFNELDQADLSTTEKGCRLEKFTKKYLKTDPQYSNQLEQVWLWSELPYDLGSDTGIDLVAKTVTGDYWAIQCKFFSPAHTINKKDIDSFLATSGRCFQTEDGEFRFSQRIVVSTTSNWSNTAENALKGQDPPVVRIAPKNLADSPIDWNEFLWGKPDNLKLQPTKSLMLHQEEAINEVMQGFRDYDRGKLIMACGTGKTFVALRLAEEDNLVPQNGIVLFLAPSLSLVGQTLREWSAQATRPFHAFTVCSDIHVSKNKDENTDIVSYDLAYPSTTDPERLSNQIELARQKDANKPVVIFSTYQSIQTIIDTQKYNNLKEFNLIVCDEAHRTTGITLPREKDVSNFNKVHYDSALKSQKRLYMTATPRIFAEKSRNRAFEEDAELYSMDDTNCYGSEFYTLNFGQAVSRGLLSDYKVLIVAVDTEQTEDFTNQFNAYRVQETNAVSTEFATKIIGTWNGLIKKNAVTVNERGEQAPLEEDTAPMRRAVAFANSIKDSKSIRDVFENVINLAYQSEDKCTLSHVDGSMNSMIRNKNLEWLREGPDEENPEVCRVLSNARCLSEGVDVPSLDGVIFFDTRDSTVEIAQSVGRVMRKAEEEGKQYGYIILPVGIPKSEIDNYESYIEQNSRFKGIWKVIRSLRAHDERLVDESVFRKKIKFLDVKNPGGSKESPDPGEAELIDDVPHLPVREMSEALYAAIPKKLGDRAYWRDWAKEVGAIADRLQGRIYSLLNNAGARKSFDHFLKSLRNTIHPNIQEKEAVEMLVQHEITRPIFEAMFTEQSFVESNVVSKSMQQIMEEMYKHGLETETQEMEKFYNQIRERATLAKSDKARQDLINNLYDSFFQNAFPKMADRLGIVYTPTEIVDFILNSVDAAIKDNFNVDIGEKDVHVLDPFAGTGTFITRLLKSGFLNPENMERKYKGGIWANEIVLLAYYIAAVNIESAYHDQMGGSYIPFNGMVLTDTFQMQENKSIMEYIYPLNSEKMEQEKKQDIKVIIGNPPYSAGQATENENNPNQFYPELDRKIKNTYAQRIQTTYKRYLYDSYIRAIRWASDRIGEKGIVGFVTNASFIDGKVMAGVRKCLYDEFSTIYCLNLRGNQRSSGEIHRKEGGHIFAFGRGSLAPIAITILVKTPAYNEECNIYYYNIGDYLNRRTKLDKLQEFQNIHGVNWQKIIPDQEGDWINQRDPSFDNFLPLGDKNNSDAVTIFQNYATGINTNCDVWLYNSSHNYLKKNISRMVDKYNYEVDKVIKSKSRLEDIIDTNSAKISWHRKLRKNAQQGRKGKVNDNLITISIYRPFNKEYLYFDKFFVCETSLIKGQKQQFFPTPNHSNLLICVTGASGNKSFSTIIVNCIPNLNMLDAGAQCFPLYWYKPVEKNTQKELFVNINKDQYGYLCHEAITDWALKRFRAVYSDQEISKEDIFYYIYGVLHSSEYRKRFENTLKKQLPRIPFTDDFYSFRDAGKQLAEFHLNYEMVEPHPLKEHWAENTPNSQEAYRVEKMKYGGTKKKKDKTTIIYNNYLTLSGIPEKTFEYQLNDKSAIDWIVDRYMISIDKDSGIVNDPNEYSEDPRYIIDLLKRIVTVSLETQKIVKSLPALQEKETTIDIN